MFLLVLLNDTAFYRISSPQRKGKVIILHGWWYNLLSQKSRGVPKIPHQNSIMTSQHQVKNPSLKSLKNLCLLSLMYENEPAILELMFQANILESFLQKRGPSLRIPAISHSKQMVAAAIWTHTSLIEDIFQEPFGAAPTHGAGMACACLPVQTAQLHSPELLICICYLLLSFQTLWASSFSFSHRQRIAKILPVFHSLWGERKENSGCSVTPVVTHNHWLRLEFHVWEWLYFKPLLQCKTERGHIAGILKSRLNQGVQVHKGNCIQTMWLREWKLRGEGLG